LNFCSAFINWTPQYGSENIEIFVFVRFLFCYLVLPIEDNVNCFLYNTLGLGLEQLKGKKEACPARVAGAGQENIKTVHEPKPIQAADTL
jgi:hypothetical protein